jgi:hypothetical protein
MNPDIERLKLIFIGIFVAGALGVGAWQIGWAGPRKACESQGKWWDHSERVCAQPVLISDITGRTIQDKQAEAKARAAIAGQAAPSAK